MAWTSPKTWSSEPLTSLDLNTYVRDNQNHLKDRLDSSVGSFISGATMLTTTSNEFVDVDSVLLSIALATHGGDVLLGFTGTMQSVITGGSAYVNVAVDDRDYIADDGIICHTTGNNQDNNRYKPLSFVILIPGLSVGGHTFKLRWKTTRGHTLKMDVVNLHPQFWAKEI